MFTRLSESLTILTTTEETNIFQILFERIISRLGQSQKTGASINNNVLRSSVDIFSAHCHTSKTKFPPGSQMLNLVGNRGSNNVGRVIRSKIDP